MNDNYRHENKYVISAGQMQILKARLNVIMQRDIHAMDGKYSIRSLYFDDYKKTRFYENENGTDPREKFRIRIYNRDASRITLELKRKEKGMTQKLSCPVTEEQCRCIMNGGIPDTDSNSHPLLIKLVTKMKTDLLKPVIIVQYEREPWIYPTGNVRVTIDSDICSSDYVTKFLDKDIPARPVMPLGHNILEVKWDDILPSFIKGTLQTDNLSQTGFSKFYYCRRFCLNGGINI